MAFEPVAREIEAKYVKNLGLEYAPVVATTTAGDVGSILRVISINANPFIDSTIAQNGSLQADGRVAVKVLVETIEHEIACVESLTNFTVHSVNAEISPDLEVTATAVLNNITSIQASENAVTFTANIIVSPQIITKEKIKYIENISTLAQQKTDTISYFDIIANTTQEFELGIELDLPSSISKILCVENQVVLKSIESGSDVINLRGEIYSNLVYLTDDEAPKLKNQKYIQDFTHELLANNILPTDVATANIQLATSNFELQGELTSGKGTVLVNNTLKTNIIVRQQKSFDAVVDAFCPEYELKSEYVSFTKQDVLPFELTYEKIDGNFVLDESSPRIDRILAVCANKVVIKKVEVKDNHIEVEGVLSCNIVFKLDDDNNSTQSVFAEIPFEISLKKDNIDFDSIINLQAVVKDVEARNKKSKEIDILGEIAINMQVNKNTNETSLQTITLGEKRELNHSPIGIYLIPQASDLWEVSKALLSSGDVIMEQNPELTFPINEPQRIVLYRQGKR